MSDDRIDLDELREAAENDGTSSTTVYIGGPGWDVVLALVEAVEAARRYRDAQAHCDETGVWLPARDAADDLDHALARFRWEER